MQSWGRTLSNTAAQRELPENLPLDRTMRAKIALWVSASLLCGATAAQPVPCASVAPEVRDRVREAGACRDAATGNSASTAPAAPSRTVTLKLSDGTVVRVPREISSNVNEERKRVSTTEPAPPKSVTRAGKSAQPAATASAEKLPPPQKLQVPDVIGRSDADAGSALAEFNVDRMQAPSAAPAGEVLAQDPAPADLAVPGSTVTLQVSDGSLATAAAASTGTAPTGANESAPAAAAAAVPAPAPVAASVIPTTRTSEGAARGFAAMLSTNGALVLGAGVSLGLILGALLMRKWLLRREALADEIVDAPAPYQKQSIDAVRVAPAPDDSAEVRFAARREPGETTIEFATFADDEAAAIEQSSEQHG